MATCDIKFEEIRFFIQGDNGEEAPLDQQVQIEACGNCPRFKQGWKCRTIKGNEDTKVAFNLWDIVASTWGDGKRVEGRPNEVPTRVVQGRCLGPKA